MIGAFFAALSTPGGRGVAVFVMLATGLALYIQGARLKTGPETSRAVVSLEVAKTAAVASAVIRSWERERVKHIAVWQILLDFIFIAGYTAVLVAISLSAERAAAAAGIGWLAQASHYAAYVAFVPGILDCIENAGMLIMLNSGISENT